MTRSDSGFNRLFNFLTQKVCFTFAVASCSVLGATCAAPSAVFMWITIPYESRESYYRDITLCIILIPFLVVTHLCLFGLPRLWGKRWELRGLRVLNDYVRGVHLPKDIPTATLREITALLERLPGENFKIALLLSIPILTFVPLENYLLSSLSANALYVLYGLILTVAIYVIFTYMITEKTTAAWRQEARVLLAERGNFQGAQHASTLRLKFVFIMLLMLFSMVITRSLALSPLIADDLPTVITFISLILVIAGFMCNLIFHSIIATLREIARTATHLGSGQRAQFISSSIDREFIDTAMGLYEASLKIVKYRDDLHTLNLTLEQRVAERTAQIEFLSKTDPLTGAFNRGYLIENLPQEIKKSLRYQRPLSLIMCDLDHFKKVNDTYGHQTGDYVLKEFVSCVTGVYRSGIDWVARYGGEEFVVTLPETGLDGAQALAERIRQTLVDRRIVAEGNAIHITVSCGVSGFDAGVPADLITAENLIRQADRCLYMAKEAGRNRVVTQRLNT